MDAGNDTNLAAKLELLRGVSFFAALREQGLIVVAQNSEFYTFSKGEAIFSEGGCGDRLYTIREGEVLITKKREDGETVNLAQFIRGESFGEMDLLENRALTASATAETDVTLLVFPARGTRFEDVLSRHPGISAQILHELLAVIAGRIRNTNRLISEKSQWVRDLKRQLYYDKLTGLLNRAFINEEFPAQLADYGPTTAMIMIKPDNFKAINDAYGHDAGDMALRLIAFSIRSQLRQQDIAVRYRGDEFAVVFPGTDLDTALVFAEQMRVLIRRLSFDHITGGAAFTVTASIGAAAYPGHARSAGDLVGICFDRMFAARESGGDRVVSVDL
ncbi:MAG: hypothetical protein A2176_09305 [Spirochaetes bacterium RBG_13_51_14]|nr:MAG: hypothetical protein A2176_09305 [Spirochaetes bacterium RBG_13_51_14]